MNKLFIAFGFLLTLSSLGQSVKNVDNVPKDVENLPVAKNIILMIGDGMGVAQIYAGMTANKGHLDIERFQDIGFSKTYSADDYITDSGAGGTAIATGKKTYNGAIGVDLQGNACKSILEYAEDHGKSTGLVVTCSVTHATPACFVAHQSTRKNDEGIALDLVKSGVDVFFGGGLKYFTERKDGTDLTRQLSEMGYTMIYKTDSIQFATGTKIAGLLYSLHPPKFSGGRANELEESVLKTLETLRMNKKGFFLMVEGSQIDWGGHDNDTPYIVDEMIDFDRAVGLAIDFAQKDGNTLVIVTADHETGGMSLNGGNFSSGEVTAKYTTGDHTGVMVPVFAFGPGSDRFRGIYENTDIFKKMMEAYGFTAETGNH